MLNTAGEEKGHPIGIDAPHERPYAEWGALGRDNLQPHNGPAPQARAGHHFRAIIANIDNLAGIAMCPRFDDHRPRSPSPGMLPSVPDSGCGHGLTPGQLACPIQHDNGDD